VKTGFSCYKKVLWSYYLHKRKGVVKYLEDWISVFKTWLKQFDPEVKIIIRIKKQTTL